MTDPRRPLTTTDVAAILGLANVEDDHEKVFELVQTIAEETCGWVLLTTLRYLEHDGVVERVHSSDKLSHPIGGRKPLSMLGESHGPTNSTDVFLAATKADVRRAFYDHEQIFALGIGSILNAPICHAGRRLGTLNFCGKEGMYQDCQIRTSKILAGLLVPTLLTQF